MTTVEVLCPPSGDLGPNDFSPVPNVATHALNVDEDPPDNDTTYLNAATGEENFLLNLSAIPDGSRILQLRVRHRVRRSTGGDVTLMSGFRRGIETKIGLPQFLGAGSLVYFSFDDFFGVDPFKAAAWEKPSLGEYALHYEAETDGAFLPRNRLTQCVVFATIPDPDAPLSDEEIAEFWRLRRLEKYCALVGEHRVRYDYLSGRLNANNQNPKPPQVGSERDYARFPRPRRKI